MRGEVREGGGQTITTEGLSNTACSKQTFTEKNGREQNGNARYVSKKTNSMEFKLVYDGTFEKKWNR